MSRHALRLAALSVLWMAVACGGSTVVDPGGSGGQGGEAATGGATASSGPSSGAGGCEAITNCCDDTTGQEVAWFCEGDEAVCPSGASWPGPEGCTTLLGACASTADCEPGEYCDFPDDLCGAGQPGSCQPRPTACDLLLDEVCTCAGTIASNTCDGAMNGADVSNAGGCPVPPDSFACGPKLCGTQSEYCRLAVSDVGGEPSVYACQPLPGACVGDPSCACVENEPCGDICEPLPSGDVMVTCPGG